MINSRSIVLIDDDTDDQEIFRSACQLIDLPIQLVVFGSGEKALQQIPDMNSIPDLVFLDLNMPRMNGIEVLAAFKEVMALKSIPIVVYTTYYDEKVKGRCYELGAMEIIEKPNRFDLLCSKIESLLSALEKSV